MALADIQWDRLHPSEFEILVYHLAITLGYDGVQRHAGSGDKGKDVVAYLPSTLPGIRPRSRRVILQCKRTRAIHRHDIDNELAHFAAGGIDSWILVTTAQPTPQLREWLEELQSSTRYPFHIDVWWRDDLERMIGDHIKPLSVRLPNAVQRAMGLAESAQTLASANVTEVSARLREHTNGLIARYAGTKYLPHLYVDRAAEAVVKHALRPEHVVAAEIRATCMGVVAAIRQRIGKHLQEWDAAASLRRLPASPFRLHDTPRENRRLLGEIRSGSRGLLQKFQQMLEGAESAAVALSSTEYHVRKSDYRRLDEELAALALHVERMHSPEAGGAGARAVFNRQPPLAGLFSLNGLDRWIQEQVHTARQSLEEALRHGLVLVDRAGSGKTNLICHIACSLSADRPVLLFFGRQPFRGGRGVVRWVEDAVAAALSTSRKNAMNQLDQLLAARASFLVVFIDGINESRNLGAYSSALEEFLDWSAHHRIQVVLTCRDIYAEFFDFLESSPFLRRPVRGELRQFSGAEYESALPLYLDHYRIQCELGPAARSACQHPLLLRFFCEAHRDPERNPVLLGKVPDIRLKNLFGHYLERKSHAVGRNLAHRDGLTVEEYIHAIAAEMLRVRNVTLSLKDIEAATGLRNSNTEDSLYLRVLDEEIIVAEQPNAQREFRVSFVYEEFMEYMLARAFMDQAGRGTPDGQALFQQLADIEQTWPHARGLCEFIALMLLDGDYGASREQAIVLLSKLVDNFRWSDVFWNVLSKCAERHLGWDLYDLIQRAVQSGPSVRVVEGSLAVMSRSSPETCEQVAAVLLWSIAMPAVLTWSNLHALAEGVSEAELARIRSRLRRAYTDGIQPLVSADLSFGRMLDRIVPFLAADLLGRLEASLRSHHAPRRGIAGRASMLIPLAPVFPEYAPLLLNGLWSDASSVRRFCAETVRHSNFARRELIQIINELITLERDEQIRRVLLRSAQHLERESTAQKQ